MKLFTQTRQTNWQKKLGRYTPVVVVLILFGGLGTALLVNSHAATPVSSVQAESGTISSAASSVSDSTASGSQAVKFGTPSTGRSCPAYPSFPDASCTGVPAGTALLRVPQDVTSGTGWHWDSANTMIVVDANNAVLNAVTTAGHIEVTGTGVTVKNSKANSVGVSGNARDPANPRLTVQDTEIDCGNQAGTSGMGDRNITAIRVNIHACENGFDADDYLTVQDSYIHDLFNAPDGPNSPHTDGIQSAEGSYIVLTHNVFFGFDTGCHPPNNGSCNGTSAINICSNTPANCPPPIHDTTISNNLLAGGAYTLYCPQSTGVNFKITGNHFSTVYSQSIGEYGPSTNCSDEAQSGNVYHETGQPITLD